jgi:DNA-directed RNA polymerase specialized sigma24 family protein
VWQDGAVDRGLARTTDEQLVMDAREALTRGDERQARRCAAELWSRIEPRVRLQAARKTPRADVDDICATVGAQVVEYVYESAQVPRSFAAVVLTIAARRIADRTRSPGDVLEPAEELELLGAHDRELDAVLNRAEAEGLLAGLDERSATILRRLAADEAPEQIAGDLGITRSHLDVIAHRARKQVRAKQEEAR